jgi:hypothetical protein
MTTKKFKAKVVGVGPGGAWCRVHLPFDAQEEWGSAGRLSVKGTANGFAFQSSIFPNGDGTHHMMFNAQMKAGAQADAGDVVAFAMAPDTVERKVALPPDLVAAMKKSAKAKAGFAALSPSNKKGYVDWITSAKKPETRADRVTKALARLERGEKFW